MYPAQCLPKGSALGDGPFLAPIHVVVKGYLLLSSIRLTSRLSLALTLINCVIELSKRRNMP